MRCSAMSWSGVTGVTTSPGRRNYTTLCLSRWAVSPALKTPKGGLVYAHNGGRFMVSKPIDRKPATHANGGTIGFSMSGPEQA
jgi:hypothetical protein